MYVRKKRIKGREYYYLVRSVRSGNSIRQEYLAYIGTFAPQIKKLDALKAKHEGRKK
jgi:hypothetical protein